MPEYGASPQPQRLDEARGTPPDPDFKVQDLGRRRARRPVEDHGWRARGQRRLGDSWTGGHGPRVRKVG